MITLDGYQTLRAARSCSLTIVVVLLVTSVSRAQTKTYTTDTDFNAGFSINSEGVADAVDGELAIKTAPETLPFIWVACSQRGTIVRIDTQTHAVLGEYLTSPTLPPSSTCGRDPSRTTVDFDGNVWAGNRANDAGGVGSFVKIGSGFAFQWIDRDGDTLLDSSTGLGDVLDWDDNGDGICAAVDVANATDELILLYQPVSATGVRTIAVNRINNVWIGGSGNRQHGLLEGTSA